MSTSSFIAAATFFGILLQSIVAVAQPTPQAQSSTIGIRVKVFDADRPAQVLTPRLAFGYYRPGEGEEPLLLRDLTFERQENDFYLVTVPRGILLERLVILIQQVPYNVAVVTKIVTANDMIIYPGASDSTGRFSFQGYKGQLSQYDALYDELVDDLKLTAPHEMRRMFGQQMLNMPEADDALRLPGLDARQRSIARELRQKVLVKYGLRPPVVSSNNCCCGQGGGLHRRRCR